MNAYPFKVNVFMVYRQGAMLAQSRWAVHTFYRFLPVCRGRQRTVIMIYLMIYQLPCSDLEAIGR